MEINELIYRNAAKKLRDKRRMTDYIDVCIEADICPQCGEELSLEKEGTSMPPVIRFLCSSCSYSWKGVRPVGKLLIADELAPNVKREILPNRQEAAWNKEPEKKKKKQEATTK